MCRVSLLPPVNCLGCRPWRKALASISCMFTAKQNFLVKIVITYKKFLIYKLVFKWEK